MEVKNYLEDQNTSYRYLFVFLKMKNHICQHNIFNSDVKDEVITAWENALGKYVKLWGAALDKNQNDAKVKFVALPEFKRLLLE